MPQGLAYEGKRPVLLTVAGFLIHKSHKTYYGTIMIDHDENQ